jgi:hypothetical protein
VVVAIHAEEQRLAIHATADADTRELTLTGLKAATTYTIRIHACLDLPCDSSLRAEPHPQPFIVRAYTVGRMVPLVETLPEADTNDEAVLLADELAHEAQDSNTGALVEAVLSVDSEL